MTQIVNIWKETESEDEKNSDSTTARHTESNPQVQVVRKKFNSESEELLNEFMLFTSEVNEKMPHTRCFFISIKPSIFRKNYLDTILDANDKIKNAIQHLSQWKYIDLCSPMLETGYEKFYGEDPLHMNVLGYSLLSKLIRDELSIFNN